MLGEMELGRAGREIDFPSEGGTVPGYVAGPATGSGRGVLVLHEAWGLVDQIRDVCDRLAREGFVALAPDLYRGLVAADPDAAAQLMSGLDVARAGADLDAAVRALLSDPRTQGGRVGAVGFCMGGQLALFVATRNPRIGAAADFYGVHPSVPLDFARMDASVLAVFAEKDEFGSDEDVRKLELALRAQGRSAVLRVQPGVGHGFMNDARPDRYDPAAAAQNWDALLAFLRGELT